MKKSSPLHRQNEATTADIMRVTGYSRQGIADLESAGVVTKTKGKWNPLETLGAMVRRLREKDSGNEDRQRKNKAEADSAEVAAMEAAKSVVPLASAKLYWSESRIEVRQTVERAEFLSPVQKTKLLAKLAALKPKAIE